MYGMLIQKKNIMKKISRTINIETYKLIIVIVLLTISIIRILIQFRIPYCINPGEPVDDGLMQKIALHLFHGEYLGVYDEFTLCKNWVYSYLLAFCYKFLFPYPLLLGFLNIGSAYAVCRSFKNNISFVPRAIMYVLLIFSPITFAELPALRIYRNSIIQYFTLLVFAGFIGLFLRKEEKSIKPLIPWVVLECVSLPLFWFIKEDSIWILPFCVVITVLALVWVFIHQRENIIKKAIVFLGPFIATIIMSLGISFANYNHYGLFATDDRAHTEAANVYSAFLHIDHDYDDGGVWVTNEMFEQAATVSPTFAPIWEEMKVLPHYKEENGEVLGDVFMWRIRHAMNEMGYYTDAAETNEIYKKINNELQEAFNNGSLSEDNYIHISKLMKGLSIDEIIECIPKAVKNMYHVSVYGDLELVGLASTGDLKKISTQQYLLGLNTYMRMPTDFQTDINNYGNHLIEKINIIIAIYQRFGIVLDILAIIGFVVFFVALVYYMSKRDYKRLNLFIVMCGIILSAFVVAFEFEAFSGYFNYSSPTNYDDFVEFYSVAMYPLVSLFKYLAIIFGAYEVVGFIKNIYHKHS